jgi:hypothetical protein
MINQNTDSSKFVIVFKGGMDILFQNSREIIMKNYQDVCIWHVDTCALYIEVSIATLALQFFTENSPYFSHMLPIEQASRLL